MVDFTIYDLANSSSPQQQNLDIRTFIPSEIYLPEYARTEEFFRNICILIDYLEDSLLDFSNPKYAGVAQAYRDIVFKYKDIMQISEDELRKLVIEHGFGQILDLFNLPFDRLQMFALYMPLFKALKGSDEGFRLLLDLLSYDFEIKSWIDAPDELEEYTYDIVFITVLNAGFSPSILEKFIEFSRSYVYPVLKSVTVRVMFRQLSPAVYGRPVIIKEVKARCLEEISN